MWGEAGQESEEGQLGFDAAGGGSEEVDRFGFGVGQAEGYSGFEGGDVLSEGLDRARSG